MKKTIVNTLHSNHFVVKTQDGRYAKTEVPMDKTSMGAVYLPKIDGKEVTQKNYDSLKAHEYAHIALVSRGIIPISFVSDMEELGMDNKLIQTCLDAAVNAFIAEKGTNLPFEHEITPAKKFKNEFELLPIENQIAYLLQMYGVYYGSKMADTCYSNDSDVRKKGLKFKKTLRDLSRLIEKKPDGNRLSCDAYEIAVYCSNTLQNKSSYFVYETYKTLCKRLINDLRFFNEKSLLKEKFDNDLKELNFTEKSNIQWGECSIIESKMENTMMNSWKQKYTPKYVGSLRYMHRSITDMKVWGLREKSAPPFAVLIDCSGSMNISDQSVISILEKNPASIVAGYSGMGSKGSVYIIGKDGKYAGEKEISDIRENVGYANIVDGPAALWLVTQKNKRLIWITDGNATAIFETQSKDMFKFLKNIVLKYNIEVYGSIEAFEKELSTPLARK